MQQEDSFFGTTVTFPTGLPLASNYTPCLAIFPDALRVDCLSILAFGSAVFDGVKAASTLVSWFLRPKAFASSSALIIGSLLSIVLLL